MLIKTNHPCLYGRGDLLSICAMFSNILIRPITLKGDREHAQNLITKLRLPVCR